MGYLRAGIHKMLVRIANSEDPDQTAVLEAWETDAGPSSKFSFRFNPSNNWFVADIFKFCLHCQSLKFHVNNK